MSACCRLFILCFFFNLLPALLPSQSLKADPLNLAVASNFSGPIGRLIPDFEKQSGHQVRLTLGASGRFLAQISHGAPFDVFLSADQAKPRALAKAGLGLEQSRFTYAVGRLALWSADPAVVLADGAILAQKKIGRLAIANPDLAPYGRAAVEVLERRGLLARYARRLIQGENIAQAYHYVATGNAYLGFVALSQIMTTGILTPEILKKGAVWIVPENLHQPIRQDAILLTSARHNPAAQAFMAYLRSPSAARLIADFGYKTNGDGP